MNFLYKSRYTTVASSRRESFSPCGLDSTANWCVAVVLTCCVGCGAGDSKPQLSDHITSNIMRLRAGYGIYMTAHGMQGPKDEEQLKEYLTTSGNAAAKFERMGVAKDEILGIFVSERDGQPFKIRYGINGMGDFPIVFEVEGVDGKRMVAFAPPRELDAAAYEEAWAGKTDANPGMGGLSSSPN